MRKSVRWEAPASCTAWSGFGRWLLAVLRGISGPSSAAYPESAARLLCVL